MKLNKILIGSASLVLLTGCFLFQQKVSAEKFQEKVDAIEEHEYSKATVSYKIDEKGTGTYEDATEKASGKIEFTYDADSKTWSTESSDKHASQCKSYLYTIRGQKVTSMEPEDDDEMKYETTYYVNPLGAKMTVKGEYTLLGVTYKTNSSATVKFDKYGYVTKYDSKTDTSTSGEIVSGVSVSGTLKGTESYSISYK